MPRGLTSIAVVCTGTHKEDAGAKGTRGGPLQSLDGNARQAAKHEDTKRSLAARTGSSARMQKNANQPIMKRVARPRGAGGMDFGVQVYAKAPPVLQESSQVCFNPASRTAQTSFHRRAYVAVQLWFLGHIVQFHQ